MVFLEDRIEAKADKGAWTYIIFGNGQIVV